MKKNNSNNWRYRLQQASKKGQKHVVISLLRQGIEINATFQFGLTALHECSKFGHVDTARVLIEAGAEVNRKDYRSSTPLVLAILGEHIEMVKLLLESGANVNTKEITKMLVKAGAETDARIDTSYSTCLHAIRKINIADILLRNGATINIQNSIGDTPLHRAVDIWDAKTVKFLLSKGADPNIMNYRYSIPLHTAIESRNLQVAELLIFGGADLFNKVSRIGFLDKAIHLGHIDMTKLLIMHMVVKKPSHLKPEIVANEPTLSKYWDDCQADTEYMDKTLIGRSTITYRKFVLESCENKLALYLSHKTTRVKESLSNTKVLKNNSKYIHS
ncbi:hypothetical protein LAZ67_1000736 [Cordylochernes scorpioides]|uniref:Uncharacterized protein n=1 Tax=Cordylochernes scorpioides TaxID=51811 RepID=A0ABY6JXE2_9ARAC|nr:hypothetical protein LAZ67_1000736 [Cordylochernes scorpioides]